MNIFHSTRTFNLQKRRASLVAFHPCGSVKILNDRDGAARRETTGRTRAVEKHRVLLLYYVWCKNSVFTFCARQNALGRALGSGPVRIPTVRHDPRARGRRVLNLPFPENCFLVRTRHSRARMPGLCLMYFFFFLSIEDRAFLTAKTIVPVGVTHSNVTTRHSRCVTFHTHLQSLKSIHFAALF